MSKACLLEARGELCTSSMRDQTAGFGQAFGVSGQLSRASWSVTRRVIDVPQRANPSLALTLKQITFYRLSVRDGSSPTSRASPSLYSLWCVRSYASLMRGPIPLLTIHSGHQDAGRTATRQLFGFRTCSHAHLEMVTCSAGCAVHSDLPTTLRRRASECRCALYFLAGVDSSSMLCVICQILIW